MLLCNVCENVVCRLPSALRLSMRHVGQVLATTLHAVGCGIVYHSNVCVRAAYMEKYLKSLRAQLSPTRPYGVLAPCTTRSHTINYVCAQRHGDISHDSRLFEINFFCSQYIAKCEENPL